MNSVPVIPVETILVAYVRHLFQCREILSYQLNTIHNLHYYVNLMAGVREAIEKDQFAEFRRNFYSQREPEVLS
ncbi:tRNA-guanine transglycosylase [Desulfotalea psychrophila]